MSAPKEDQHCWHHFAMGYEYGEGGQILPPSFIKDMAVPEGIVSCQQEICCWCGQKRVVYSVPRQGDHGRFVENPLMERIPSHYPKSCEGKPIPGQEGVGSR